MPTPVETYFANLAARAEAAVAAQNPPPPSAVPVFDGPQDATATAWSALAVHPLSVLDTEFLSIVRTAEQRGGNDPDGARDNAFEAMTGFFALSSAAPSLLTPETVPLIDDWMRDLRASLDLVRSMAEATPAGALAELDELVAEAAELIALITTIEDLPYAGAGVRAAAAYLGMFATPVDRVAERWARSHDQPAEIHHYIDEVEERLVDPLTRVANAVASSRSLYNIAPFYLFRLMHRFLGGDQAAPMDLVSLGLASSEVTKAMHPPGWTWMTAWHEAQIVALNEKLVALDESLRRQFETDDDVIRFFLRGGRAMFTALGQPERGENDWDTAVLINPGLSPEHWYAAFAQVNDAIVSFLDRARFSYSALLARHGAELNDLTTCASPVATPEPPRYFSRLALLADHEAERAEHRRLAARRPATRGHGGAALAPRPRVRPVGVNGELIDVGISKRASVELLEHWLEVETMEKRGVTIDGVPVPTLPYFIDDFSTIVREALATDAADRKLAKRLVRLKLVLQSDDATLDTAAEAAAARASAALPRSSAALGARAGDSAGRIAAWIIARLIQSLPDLAFRPGFAAVLDAAIAGHAATLLQPAAVEGIWQQVRDGIAEADRAACRSILLLQNAGSVIARRLVQDGATLAQAIGGPSLAPAPLWRPVQEALSATFALNGRGTGLFYLTGGLAGQLQTAHAGIAPHDLTALCPDGAVEVLYRAGRGSAPFNAQALQNRLATTLGATGLTAAVAHGPGGPAVVVRGAQAIRGLNIPDPKPTFVLIRAEGPGAETATMLDYLGEGWPVASTRDLVRLFNVRAAHSPDPDLRRARARTASFLLDDVLGRQLR